MYINNIYKGAEKVVTSGDDLQIRWESKTEACHHYYFSVVTKW